MLQNILKQQLLGLFNLSIPFIILYQIYPAILLSTSGKIICSLLMGLYVFYLDYRTTKTQTNSLKYSPSLYKPELEQIIIDCSMSPQSVNLRYGYSSETIAMTIMNTVIIDPILCQKFNQDPEAIKVIDILNHSIIRAMPDKQKERIEKIKNILTPEVQIFIFKHELGHVFANYSYKKSTLIGLTAVVIAYTGFTITFYFLKTFGFFAILIGIIIAGLTDLILGFSSNILFKAREEKNADLFAAKFSSPAEINAAANFFEILQEIVNADKPSMKPLDALPSTILNGYYDGKTRAKYLRAVVKSK